MKKNILGIVGSILLCELAGIVGAFFTTPNITTWYAGLIKPALNPPNWVFGPVWIMLYALMGVAFWLVWSNTKADRKIKQRALVFFFAQLVLNVLWSVIFFGQHFTGGAFCVILVLWVLIVLTIIYFVKISKPAAWLLAPYLLWVTFATYLNLSIYLLN